MRQHSGNDPDCIPRIGESAGKRNILIVEDDLSLRPFWDSIMRGRWPEISIQWVLSAETALELLQSDQKKPPFDILIVDLFLSGSLTGLDVLDAIERASWKNDVEIIVSTMCDPAHLRQSLSPAHNGVKILAKPYDVRQCISAVMGALSRLRIRDQQQGGPHCHQGAKASPY